MADMVVLKAIVSLSRAGEEKHIERYKTMLKVAVEKKKYYRVSWAQRASSKV